MRIKVKNILIRSSLSEGSSFDPYTLKESSEWGVAEGPLWELRVLFPFFLHILNHSLVLSAVASLLCCLWQFLILRTLSWLQSSSYMSHKFIDWVIIISYFSIDWNRAPHESQGKHVLILCYNFRLLKRFVHMESAFTNLKRLKSSVTMTSKSSQTFWETNSSSSEKPQLR